MPCKIIIACALIACAGSVVADTLSGRVVAIADGDTLTLLDTRMVTGVACESLCR